MNIPDLKSRITMREVAERFGLELDRSGFARCPFHDEKTASMKIYDRDFHCFGCKAHGDQIDFIQMMDRCDFRTAAETLARMTGFILMDEPRRPSIFKERQQAAKVRREHLLAKIDKEYGELVREHCHIASVLDRKPKSWDEIDDQFTRALMRDNIVIEGLERLEYERNKIDY